MRPHSHIFSGAVLKCSDYKNLRASMIAPYRTLSVALQAGAGLVVALLDDGLQNPVDSMRFPCHLCHRFRAFDDFDILSLGIAAPFFGLVAVIMPGDSNCGPCRDTDCLRLHTRPTSAVSAFVNKLSCLQDYSG
jgi:hypothetical protein